MTSSPRKFKPDQVPEDLFTKIPDAAIRAPSAGNAQNRAFVVVRDPEQRRRFGVIYNKAAGIVGSIYAARGRPAHMSEEQYRRFMSAGAYPWDHIVEALPQNRRRAVLSRGAEGAASGRYEILYQRRKADRFRIYANSRQNSAPPNLVPFHSQPGLGGVGGST